MAQVQVKWIGDMQFVGVDSSKHAVVMSTQDEANGTGMKPSELLLVAMAGCSAVDVVNILQKKRQDLHGLEINVKGEHDENPPRPYRRIEVEYVVSGRGLKEKAVADAIRLSEEKYCSVAATVRGVAQITSSYRIIEI
jgi:putative redox protein